MGQFLLKSWAIFLFMFCFTNILNIFFHLSLAPCIKTHTKMQEMALKRLYFSKFSWGACPRTPLKVLTPSAQVGQIRAPPPQFLSPYVYANCSLYFKNTSSHIAKSEKEQPPKYSVFKNPMKFKSCRLPKEQKIIFTRQFLFLGNTCK